MKRISAIIIGLFVASLAAYFLLTKPSDNFLKTASSTVNDSSRNVLTQNTKPIGVKNTEENLIPSKDLNALKERAKTAQKELELLAVEFNNNLANVSEKKKIQEKYVLQTQEYNKLVLQIVQQAKLAEQESSK